MTLGFCGAEAWWALQASVWGSVGPNCFWRRPEALLFTFSGF